MVQLDKSGVRINGEYKTLLCASLFYFRLPHETWDDRITALKNTGYNCIDVYFPWNFHEIKDGEWTFEGMADVDSFLKKTSEAGLYIVARPGPYICSEWDGGALPARLLGGDYDIRQNDATFLAEVDKWFSKILPIIAKHEIKEGDSGGVIMLQLENELDFFDCKDAAGYLGELAKLAKKHGVSVPYFACAGQKDIIRAGGTAEGVIGTYNFYPDSRDSKFVVLCKHYYGVTQKLGIPLLVTETNRDHFLLRRQLACGAKLLGAYNQVAGSNFGFTSAVNNWGKPEPLSYISTKYDFGSLITSIGEYNNEVGAARELGLLIKAFGEELAMSQPSIAKGFEIGEFDLVVRLRSGGYLICRPCYESLTAPFVPYELDLLPFGLKGKVKSANTEILGFDKANNTVIFKAVKDATIAMEGDVGCKFITDEDIKELFGGIGVKVAKKYTDITELKLQQASPAFLPVEGKHNRLNMEALGVYNGWVKYDITGDFSKGLLLESAADIITARIDGKHIDTRIGKGSCLEYGGGSSAEIIVEQWGHSNFDDARNKNIRIASKRGITGAYGIISKTTPKLFDFTLMDDFGSAEITTESDPLCALLDVSLWNSTITPMIGKYATIAIMTGDKMFVKVTDKVECAIYVDGVIAGNGYHEWVEVTPFMTRGKKAQIAVVYRKQHWAVDCGEVTLYDLKALEVAVSKMQEKELVSFAKQSHKPTSKQALLSLKQGEGYYGELILSGKECRYIEVIARDIKITFILGDRVVGRIVGEFEGRPTITGGSEVEFYIPGAWIEKDNILRMYIECVGTKPKLKSVRQRVKN